MSSNVREHRQTVRRDSSPQADMDQGLQEMCSQMEINNNSFPTHKAIDKSLHIAYVHPYFNWCLLHPTIWSQRDIAVSHVNRPNSLSAVYFIRDRQLLDLFCKLDNYHWGYSQYNGLSCRHLFFLQFKQTFRTLSKKRCERLWFADSERTSYLLITLFHINGLGSSNLSEVH